MRVKRELIIAQNNFEIHLKESSLAGNDEKLGYSNVYKCTDFFTPKGKDYNHEDFKGYANVPCKRQFLTAFFEIEKCKDKCCNCDMKSIKSMDFD